MKCIYYYIIGCICFLISMINTNSILILFILPAIIFLFIGTVCSIIEVFKQPPKTKNIDNIDTYFIKNDTAKPRKSDGNIQKGDVKLCFNEDTFEILQSEETIKNKIKSIYFLDIWNYENETYYKISMRSHNEYMFKDMNGEIETISKYLKENGIKIGDNR